MGILDEWIDDIPQQFQDKKYIEALISAFANQLDELKEVFSQLDLETDLDTAVGTNLDMVGDIVSLTRKEAGILAGIDVTEPVMSDDRYRQFLKYQMLVNTNECTYHDLMEGLALLWNVSPIYYLEDSALPAVIILTMPFLTPGGEVVTLGEVPMVKPAGVRIEFEYYVKVIVEIAFNFLITSYSAPRCNTIVCGTYPTRSTLGKIILIDCEENTEAIIKAFESSTTGTIRVGGSAYDATLGTLIDGDIEVVINSNLELVDVLQAGQSISGTYPSASNQGIIIPKDIVADDLASVEAYNTDSTGTISIGGSTLSSAETVSVAGSTEAEANVYIAAATIRTCGAATCGNK